MIEPAVRAWRGRIPRPPRLAAEIAGGLALLALLAGPGRAATLEASVDESNEGYYQLHWEADEPVRLVESDDPDFAVARTLYAGADTARVVSGKPDGRWYYRLESESEAEPRVLSETVTVTVRHHSLGRAFAFFTLGAIVFVATLILVVFGNKANDERT